MDFDLNELGVEEFGGPHPLRTKPSQVYPNLFPKKFGDIQHLTHPILDRLGTFYAVPDRFGQGTPIENRKALLHIYWLHITCVHLMFGYC
jgi:hypothetical protein